MYYPTDYAPYKRQSNLVGALTRQLREREAAMIARALPHGARVLEIGCAAGDLLVPLREHGCEVRGIELSDDAASVARDRYGLWVHTGTLADAPIHGETFDAVVMRHVIEHLPAPRAELMQIHALLNPGGTLFIATDNFDCLDRRVFGKYWYGLDTPRHLNLFTIPTLTRLVQETGFMIGEIRHSFVPNAWILSLRYRLEARLGKRKVFKHISLQNPILLALFGGVASVQAITRTSGRITMLAIKAQPAYRAAGYVL